jgi:hypothetical protein
VPNYKKPLACFAALALWLISAGSTVAQEHDLKNEDLSPLGSKLPTYLSDIRALSTYQRRLTTHQKLFIQWDSMNGRRDMVKKQEADAYGNTSGTFTLVKQLKAQAGSPGPVDTSLNQGRILIVGRSDSREIRCLATIRDPREMHAEFFDKKTPERLDFVNPTVTIDLDFCDDPAIAVLDFLQLDPQSTTEKVFKRLGSLSLGVKPTLMTPAAK